MCTSYAQLFLTLYSLVYTYYSSSAQLLLGNRQNPTQEWLNILPQLATRYEISLYRSATSFDIYKYKDMSTLKQRLQQLI